MEKFKMELRFLKEFIMKIIIFTSVLCFLVLAKTSAQISQFGGPNRNGIYHESGLLDQWPIEGPELVATISGIGDGFGSPSINEKGIYIAGMIDSTGYIYHFDHHYKLKWKTKVGREYSFKYVGSRGTPTVENNRLYYVASFGDAVCLDATTGEKIWHVNIQAKYNGPEIKWGYTESPLLYKEKIFFTPGGKKNNFIALNKANGNLIWSLDLDSTVNSFCSPVIIRHNEKDLILLNSSNYILLIDPINGEVLVKHPLTDSHYNHALPPLYKDGKLFYSSGYDEGAVLFQIKEGKHKLDTIYTNKDLDCKLSGMILYDGTVFGTGDQKKLWVGVDFETGKTLFTSRIIKPGSLIQADNKFYLYSDVGEVALAKPSKNGFAIISRFTIPCGKAIYAFSHPVIFNGLLFIRYNNDLWLYKIK
jgi:outer membrane protein assembly factor BamB